MTYTGLGVTPRTVSPHSAARGEMNETAVQLSSRACSSTFSNSAAVIFLGWFNDVSTAFTAKSNSPRHKGMRAKKRGCHPIFARRTALVPTPTNRDNRSLYLFFAGPDCYRGCQALTSLHPIQFQSVILWPIREQVARF